MAADAAEALDRMDPEISGIDPKLLQQLADDNVDTEIIKDELQHMSLPGTVAATTFRERLVLILRHSATEGVKLSLILLDAIMILAIIILDVYIVEAELEEKDESATTVLSILKARCDNSTLGLLSPPLSLDTAFATLTAAVEQDSSLNYTVGVVVRDGTHYHTEAELKLSQLKRWTDGLHYASIAILSLFVIDLLLKIISYGKKFFYYKLEVVDGIVIIASLAIDIFLTKNSVQDLSQALLIIFLMWRLIRIFNGMMLTARARTNFRIRVLKKALRNSEDKVGSLREQVNALEKEIKSVQLLSMINAKSCSQLDTISLASAASKTTVRSIKSLVKGTLAQAALRNGKIPRRVKRRTLASSTSSGAMDSYDDALAYGVYKRVHPNGIPGLQSAVSESRLPNLDEASFPTEAPAATKPQRLFHSHPSRKRSSSEADLTQESAVGQYELSGPSGGQQPSSRRGSADDRATFDFNGSATSGVVSRQSSCDLTSLDTGVSLTSLAPPSPPSAADEANNNDERCSQKGADDDVVVKRGEGKSSLQRSARRERKLLTWCVNETAAGSDGSAGTFTRL